MMSSPAPSLVPRAPRRIDPTWRVIVLLACTLLAGCRTGARTQATAGPGMAEPPSYAREDAIPDWLGEPLSWDKLARIEAWLETEGRGASPAWRIEGELALNSGRVEFARRELEADAGKAGVLVPRLRTARVGFERVLAREDLSEAQRRRAKDGLARAERLLVATPSPGGRRIGIPVVARAEWGAMPPKLALMDRTVGAYTRLTVHHSADRDPVQLDGSAARSFQAVRDIQRAHMNGKETHYGDIGYHFVIDPYGRVIEGRDLAYQGAHAKGDNNVRNIGICVIGNFDNEKPTQAALAALRRTLDDLRRTYGIPASRVFGHKDLRSTECPGRHLTRWLESYRG